MIETLLGLKQRHGDFLLNERRALELALSSTCRPVTDRSDMKVRALAVDYRLRRRRPCCYGEDVDCDPCAGGFAAGDGPPRRLGHHGSHRAHLPIEFRHYRH